MPLLIARGIDLTALAVAKRLVMPLNDLGRSTLTQIPLGNLNDDGWQEEEKDGSA
jgi:hypothetical protein